MVAPVGEARACLTFGLQTDCRGLKEGIGKHLLAFSLALWQGWDPFLAEGYERKRQDLV